MIRVIVVEQHTAFRQALALVLDGEPDLTVVGQAGSLVQARDLLPDVDVALVGLELSNGHGTALLAELRAASTPVRALMLAAGRVPQKHVRNAVAAGAAGVLPSSAGLAEIITAVRRLGAGDASFTPGEPSALEQRAGATPEQQKAQAALRKLTQREHEVLQALADGLTDKEIAQRLHISTETVRTHMVRLLAKLGVESRLQALVFAVRHGAVTIKYTMQSEGESDAPVAEKHPRDH